MSTTLQNSTAYDRTTNPLRAFEVDAGQVYETPMGERIEIIEDDARGDKPLRVRYPERETLDENGEIVAPVASMSRYSFADMATYDGFSLVEDAEDAHEDRMPGAFVGPAPRCARCAKFMSRYYDGEGMPLAMCGGEDCDYAIDAYELIESGSFEEAR